MSRVDMAKAKEQTFGCEIEMYNIGKSNAAHIAAGYFGTDHVHYAGGSYDTYEVKDTKGRTWKFVHDSSIRGSAVCEMVTPILKYEDMELLQGLIRELRHAGAKADPNHMCGVHIHVGAQDQTTSSLRMLVNAMAAHEHLLAKGLELDADRVLCYCKCVDKNFLEELNNKKPKNMKDLEDIWYITQGESYNRERHYNRSRYHMLNLHSVFHGHGTVEFRMFQFNNKTEESKGGLHAGRLRAYIEFSLAITNWAKTAKKAEYIKSTMSYNNPKYTMRSFLHSIGLKGEEYRMTNDVFTDKLTGTKYYKEITA